MIGDSLHMVTSFLYSGKNDHHEQGVGLLINRKLSKALIGWTLFGRHLLKTRFNSKFIKLTVVVCYDPHKQNNAGEKDDFYQQLRTAIEAVPAHDILVLRDMNARTGPKNRYKERYIGKHGIGELNDNGERLVSLLEELSSLKHKGKTRSYID